MQRDPTQRPEPPFLTPFFPSSHQTLPTAFVASVFKAIPARQPDTLSLQPGTHQPCPGPMPGSRDPRHSHRQEPERWDPPLASSHFTIPPPKKCHCSCLSEPCPPLSPHIPTSCKGTACSKEGKGNKKPNKTKQINPKSPWGFPCSPSFQCHQSCRSKQLTPGHQRLTANSLKSKLDL